MSETIIIGIVPPREIQERVESLRKQHSSSIKGSRYPLHQPHITIYMNSFSDTEEVVRRVRRIFQKSGPFMIRIDGVDAFPVDPATGEQVWKLSISKDERLKMLREEIITAVSDLQTPEQADWLLKLNPNFTKEQKELVRKYATPIAPEQFKFHITIFSSPKTLREQIASEQRMSFQVSALHILKGDGKRFVLSKVIR